MSVINQIQVGSTTYDIQDAAAVPSSRTINGKALSSNITLSASDVGAMPSTYTAPVTSVNGNTGAVVLSIPSAATTTPLMDGTAAVGTATKYAREDHKHPSDTTKYSINNYGQGSTDVSIRPLIAGARANRLAFLPADQIIIEQTTDGGTTWEDAGKNDSAKKGLFATRNGDVQIPLLNGERNELCGVRITITAMKYNVPDGTAETEKYNYWNSTYISKQERYTNLREMWFWVSANSDALRVQVYRATGANPNTWVQEFNTDFAVKGWSGSDWVRLSGASFGGSASQTGNYWNWRIFFWSRMNDGATEFTGTTVQSVQGINGYGDSWWGASNSMMKEDHLYTWDVNQNASFPANVTATQFNGNLNGNATTATTATKVSAVAGTAYADRHVWFSDSAYEVNRNYDDDFKYNPSTNTLTVSNVTGNAATATTATKATQDESGNNIKTSYAASMSLSGTTLSLMNKNSAALSTVTLAIPSSAADVGAVPTTRTINGHALSANISLTASDVNALPTDALANRTLYYADVACAVSTGDIATVSNAAISSNHVVANISFANPSYITTDVNWTTSAGSLVLSGECTDATTANILLVLKDN